jgi:hypothetical protein
VQHDWWLGSRVAHVKQNVDFGAVSQMCRVPSESTSPTRLACAAPLRGLASGSGRVESAWFFRLSEVPWAPRPYVSRH